MTNLMQQQFVAALGQGDGERVRELVAAGADVNRPIGNPGGETPLIRAITTGQSDMVDLLLANRAELLLALELVTQESLRLHSDDHSRISFDANDYRALRIEELRLSALTAAEKVKRTGTPFRFNPMNSRERRVIHIALRNESDLRSESAGAGPFRHVVIYPAGMPSLPDVPPPPQRPYERERRPPRGRR